MSWKCSCGLSHIDFCPVGGGPSAIDSKTDLSKLIQAVNNDPEVVLAELNFKKAERHLEAARADLRSRRQIADKRHRARLLLEQRKAEIAQLEAEVESTYDRSTEGQR